MMAAWTTAWRPPIFPPLTDAVILLRPLVESDAESHVSGEDAESIRWLNEGHTSSVDGVRFWIQENTQMWQHNGPRLTLAIRDASTDALLGMVEANTDAAALGLQQGEANISYQVYPLASGRGVAARAVALMLNYLQSIPSLTTAAVQTAPDNVASTRTALRLGFTHHPSRRGQHGMDLYTRPLR